MARGPARDVALPAGGCGQPAEFVLDEMPGVGGMLIGKFAVRVGHDKVARVGQGRAVFGSASARWANLPTSCSKAAKATCWIWRWSVANGEFLPIDPAVNAGPMNL